MLTPPDGLLDEDLALAVLDTWGLVASSLEYRPVGFGSHHWNVAMRDGARWFVTVDELGPPLEASYHRLHAALATALDLRESGAEFVVAPTRTLAGEPLLQHGERFGVALYPFVEGVSFDWGDYSNAEHRRGVLELIIRLHSVPTPTASHAMIDDFAIPHRELVFACLDGSTDTTTGPYAAAMSALMVERRGSYEALRARYDALVHRCRADAGGVVVTHGEPHPGNTMLTSNGWVLIDWDTVLIAPPERDLWTVATGDASVLDDYTNATGIDVQPEMLELYRVRWELADIAEYLARFSRPHADSADDEKSWAELQALVERLSQ